MGERCIPWRAGSQAKGFGEIEVDNVSLITIAKSEGNAVVNYALATRAVRRMRWKSFLDLFFLYFHYYNYTIILL